MRDRLLMILIMAAVVFMTVSAVVADVPTLIGYQGVLLDSEGDPVTEPVNVTFTIYDSPSDGTTSWQETQLVEFDESGRFDVSLGESTPITDDVFNDPVRWLGVQVEGDDELVPRTRIVSVAYANRISTVDGASGGTISGDVAIQSDLDVDGDIRVTGKATIGPGNTNSGGNAFVAGSNNTANGTASTVGGGSGNIAGGTSSTISGGYSNNAGGDVSAVCGGDDNSAGGYRSAIGGGNTNTADGENAVVGGGTGNIASGDFSTIGGGKWNNATSWHSTVAGGNINLAIGENSFVGGGYANIPSGEYAAISGGRQNRSIGTYGTVGGGIENTSGDTVSVSIAPTIGGGEGNYVGGDHGTVGGGLDNIASGNHATVAGGNSNIAGGDYSAILGGSSNAITETGDNSYLFGINSILTQGSTFMVDMPHIRFGDETDGYEFPTSDGAIGQAMTTDGNGQLNWQYPPAANWTVTDSVLYTSNYWGIARGGADNILIGDSIHTMINLGVACTTGFAGAEYYACTVGGGYGNAANEYGTTVAGGYQNLARNEWSTVSGGALNKAMANAGVICGGAGNTVSADRAIVLGGDLNTNGGSHSVILGGSSNVIANGAYESMAFGSNVNVNSPRKTIFYDGGNFGRLGVNRDDNNGGVNWPLHIGTHPANGNGAYLTFTGVWFSISSRKYKENFQPFNRDDLFRKISNLDIETWQYKGSTERHVGPYAEEFNEAFDTGAIAEDGTPVIESISMTDVAGVALAGVKELINDIEELKRQNAALETRIAELEGERR